MALLHGRAGALLLAAALVACADRDGSPVAATAPDTQSAPVVTSFFPTQGTISGGVVVTFSGVGFREGTTVTFGGIFAADVRVISGTLMYAVAPSHAAGDVDVVVRNTNGRSTMTSARYHYVDDTGSCAGCWDY